MIAVSSTPARPASSHSGGARRGHRGRHHQRGPLPGIQRALERANVTVPQDFSIAGVAARHSAEDVRPQLTAADVPTLEMGTSAVDLLLERIAAPDAPARHLLLTPPISLRASTGPAPIR